MSVTLVVWGLVIYVLAPISAGFANGWGRVESRLVSTVPRTDT